jgi:hypothetical protein
MPEVILTDDIYFYLVRSEVFQMTSGMTQKNVPLPVLFNAVMDETAN